MLKTPFFAGNAYYTPHPELARTHRRKFQHWHCLYTPGQNRPPLSLNLYLPPSHTRASVIRAFEHAIAAHPQEPDA